MKLLHGKPCSAVVLAFSTVAIAGCGNGESSASSDDKWFDAGNVALAYDAQIRMDAINADKNQFEADRSCAAMLPMAQESLSDSSNAGTSVQLMYKTCNDAGFRVRCVAKLIVCRFFVDESCRCGKQHQPVHMLSTRRL